MNRIGRLLIALIIIAAASAVLFFYQVIFTTYESGFHLLLYAVVIIGVFLLDYTRTSSGLRIGKSEKSFYIILPSLIFLFGYILSYTMIDFFSGLQLMIAGLVYYLYVIYTYWGAEDKVSIIFWRKIIFSFTILFVGFTLCLQRFLFFFGIPVAAFGYFAYIQTKNSHEMGERKLFKWLNKLIPVIFVIFTFIGVFG